MPRLLLLLCITCSVLGQSPAPAVANQTEHALETQAVRDVNIRYLVFLPEGYEKEPSRKWPLIYFLHGAGERGDNLDLVRGYGPPKIAEERPGFPFIVVSPQCPRGRFWSNEDLLALLDEVISRYAVDEDRIYLTGLSMGGYGTWSLAAQAPDRFAAIAPVCGGGMRIFSLMLRDMPVWVFHGAKDRTVPLDESERMVEALKRRGNTRVKFTVYPDADHDSWTETYNNHALYDWFLEQRRSDRGTGRANR